MSPKRRLLLDPEVALQRFLAAAPASVERERAREELIVSQLPLVRSVAARFRPAGVERSELVQVGILGLITAVDRFDPGVGTPFAGFAAPWIEGEIRHFLRDTATPIRLPRSVSDFRAVVIRSAAQLTHELGRVPRVDEVARRAQVAERIVLSVMATSALSAPLPLDEAVLPTTGSMRAWDADDAVDRVETRETLNALLATLDDRSRLVVQGYFFDGRPQIDIAVELGVTQMTVSRIINRALRQLRLAAEHAS